MRKIGLMLIIFALTLFAVSTYNYFHPVQHRRYITDYNHPEKDAKTGDCLHSDGDLRLYWGPCESKK